MTRKDKPVLFAHLDPRQHEALRKLAFEEHRSMADLAREALDLLVAARAAAGKRGAK